MAKVGCCSVLLILCLLTGCAQDTSSINEFVVFCPQYMQNDLNQNIIPVFKKEHPEIAVNYYLDGKWTEEELKIKLHTEMMAGKGPDLIIASPDTLTDIYKIATSGAFYDINIFMLEDTSLQLDESYMTAVMKAGFIDGHQYFVPLQYTTASFLSTREILEENGFDAAACTTQNGFLNEAELFFSRNSERCLVTNDATATLLSYQFPDLIDYEGIYTDMDVSRFKIMLELFKLDYKRSIEINDTLKSLNWYQQLSEGYSLFTIVSGGYSQFQRMAMLKTIGEPIVIPVYDTSDKVVASVNTFAAIGSTSKNPQIAYDFIKLLLTDYQNPMDADRNSQRTPPLLFHPVRIAGEETMMLAINNSVGTPVRIMHDGRQIGEAIPMGQLMSSDFDEYMKTVQSVNAVGFYTPAWEEVNRYFTAYIKDERNFESCWEDFQNYLTIYLSE